MKWQEAGKNCIMKSSMICTVQQIHTFLGKQVENVWTGFIKLGTENSGQLRWTR
jgi:hypothetical protein